MSYNLNADKLRHPLLKKLLADLMPLFTEQGVKYFIIGATARDILMEIYGKDLGRRTQDIDIAIAIKSWNDYDKIETEILSLKSFTKDNKQKQRFIYMNEFQIDLIPFGKIADEQNRIFWPPDENFAMSVLGFEEANKNSIEVKIDHHNLKVASLESIFVFKLIAWKDRNFAGNKDADDIGFILQNYLPINEERAAHNYYTEVFEVEDFSIVQGSAVLLGKDISTLLKNNSSGIVEIKSIIETELAKRESSRLLNQIIETNKISYDELYRSLSMLNMHLR